MVSLSLHNIEYCIPVRNTLSTHLFVENSSVTINPDDSILNGTVEGEFVSPHQAVVGRGMQI